MSQLLYHHHVCTACTSLIASLIVKMKVYTTFMIYFSYRFPDAQPQGGGSGGGAAPPGGDQLGDDGDDDLYN